MALLATIGRALLSLPRWVWTAIVILPFVFIVLLSLRSMTDIYTNPLGFTGAWVPENFAEAWRGPVGGTGFVTYFTNTVIVTAVAIAVSLAAGATAAYFTSQLSVAARRRVMAIFVAGTIVPIIVLLIPFFQVFNALGLLSSPWAVGVLYGGLTLPTTVLVLHAFFVDFPGELRDAAAIDGLGHFSTYLRVVLPLSKAPMAAVSMLTAVWVWGETQVGLVLLQASSSQTVPVGVLSFQGQFTSNQGPLFAALTMAAVPLLIAYLAAGRYITKGIALGGVFR